MRPCRKAFPLIYTLTVSHATSASLPYISKQKRALKRGGVKHRLLETFTRHTKSLATWRCGSHVIPRDHHQCHVTVLAVSVGVAFASIMLLSLRVNASLNVIHLTDYRLSVHCS